MINSFTISSTSYKAYSLKSKKFFTYRHKLRRAMATEISQSMQKSFLFANRSYFCW